MRFGDEDFDAKAAAARMVEDKLGLPWPIRESNVLRFIAPLGCEPVYGNPYAAGIDLRAAIGGRIEARALATFHTGLRVEIPPGHVGLVRGRSGLAFKHCIWAYDGTIDEDYRGEILVLLENKSIVPHIVQAGDRIAQLVILPVARPTLVPVQQFEAHDGRGSNGFGSTGAK